MFLLEAARAAVPGLLRTPVAAPVTVAGQLAGVPVSITLRDALGRAIRSATVALLAGAMS